MGRDEIIEGGLYMEVDDAIAIGDISTAFLFGKEYGPDERPGYVKV